METAVNAPKEILVVGGTGLQGRYVCQELPARGYGVSAVTRDASTPKAQAVRAMGAGLVRADISTEDPFEKMDKVPGGLFVALESDTKDVEKEFRQGMNVIGAAEKSGVDHVVYSSIANPDADNGVRYFAMKARLEQALRQTALNWTILRPVSFMDTVREKKFVPPVLWHVWSKVTGWDTPLRWVSARDVARAAAAAFDTPETSRGRVFSLAADNKSLRDVHRLIVEKNGRAPRRIPMPVWLFRSMVSKDLINLFNWQRQSGFEVDTSELRELVSDPLDFASWLETQ